MFAIVGFKGHQFRAEKGKSIKVPFLGDMEEGKSFEISDVLMLKDDADVIVGRPTVANAKVVAEVVAHKKDKKIIVFKKKRRKGYRVKNGHRQNFTEIKITDIVK
eukprot:Anaeramoba_ignava/a359815_10.p1 GENE.a359815_10~~a359815_10.p1  ORF type:complete len:105 (+),score=17.85 a359815_10:22-336(+)